MSRVSPRWRLVGRELSHDRVRTALAVLAMAVSVMSIGMVSGASVILVDTLDRAYVRNQAADAVFQVTPVDAATLTAVRAVPGVALAEGRGVVHARLQVAGEDWRNLDLIAVPDYAGVQVDRFFPQAGAWPPPDGAVLLERSSLAYLGRRIGDRLSVESPGGAALQLPVAGTAHDLNYPSAVASGLLHGYISFDTFRRLTGEFDFTEIHVRTAGLRDLAAIERTAGAVRAELERRGARVLATVVPPPGRFWADDQIAATVLLLDTLAVLAFLMSGFLVANIVSALIARQVRVIGVMKAVGASPRQVVGVYLGLVLAYGLLALLVGVPAGAAGALGIVESTRAVLNFDPPGFLFSPSVLGLQVATALLVALVAALRPVIRAGRLTVREAITPEADTARGGGRFRLLAIPARLAARNAFRRRGRLALTLAALLLGGLAFVSVLTVRSSLDSTLDQAAAARGYDVQLVLGTAHPRADVERLAATTPGARDVESWARAGAYRVRADGSTGGTIQVVAAPAGSRLLRPPLLAGRWLAAGDVRTVVVNSDVVHDEPGLAPGARLVLRFGGQDTDWLVVGVARGLLGGPIAYTQRDQVEAVLGSAGFTDNVEVIGSEHSAAAESRLARALTTRFTGAGYAIDGVDTTAQWRDFLAADYSIATNFLLGMACLLAAVGGLTLMGTMGINVIERTREIGVMRAIGASDRTVQALVVGEGLVVAGAGWLLAAPLSPLAGRLLSDAFGQAFLHVPLTFAYAWPALGLWLVLVLLVAAASSLVPAWNASRLTVREVLAYS